MILIARTRGVFSLTGSACLRCILLRRCHFRLAARFAAYFAAFFSGDAIGPSLDFLLALIGSIRPQFRTRVPVLACVDVGAELR